MWLHSGLTSQKYLKNSTQLKIYCYCWHSLSCKQKRVDMNQTWSAVGCQSDVQTVRQIAFYDSHLDDRQADGWHHPESNLGDRHWYSHVTLPQTVTAGQWVIDGLWGRHGKYKTATVFLVPVTDTPTMTPFSLMDCHIIAYEGVPLSLSCSAA